MTASDFSFSASPRLGLSALAFFALIRAVHGSAWSKLAAIALIVLKAGLCFIGLAVLTAEAFIIGASRSAEPEPGLDYLIVLGAPLENGEISTVLRSRVDAAVEDLSENAGTVAILTGTGTGKNAPTQAQAMYDPR